MVTRTGHCMFQAWNIYQDRKGFQDRELYDRPGHGMVTRTGNCMAEQGMEWLPRQRFV
ncbi:hypothetical protein DPMN_138486 [Dreissena polymorpha]|uniref:Uncharacterized protein n=1 Tax=Dreissena polymorpha TaxID=45954 RepID=A0A9D4G3X5_DREPO|nr:hypothetical protein DPMN_138486 [Dreissena polymorpha]